MRSHLEQGGWTLADIGTSEEDLSQRLQGYYKKQAKQWYFSANNGTSETLACVDHIREFLKQGNLILSDIGISEDSLSMAISEYHNRKALEWLGLAKGTSTKSFCVQHMRNHLSKGNLTLADIGMTEENLLIWLSSKEGDGLLLSSLCSLALHEPTSFLS